MCSLYEKMILNFCIWYCRLSNTKAWKAWFFSPDYSRVQVNRGSINVSIMASDSGISFGHFVLSRIAAVVTNVVRWKQISLMRVVANYRKYPKNCGYPGYKLEERFSEDMNGFWESENEISNRRRNGKCGKNVRNCHSFHAPVKIYAYSNWPKIPAYIRSIPL